MITFRSIKRTRLFVLVCMSIISSHGINGAIWYVTSTLDNNWDFTNFPLLPNSDAPGNPVTLRSAIQFLNFSSAFTPGDTIAFDFGTQPPPYIIQPGAFGSPNQGNQLPTIFKQVTIDGYVGNPGEASVSTATDGSSNAVLTVVINGSNYTVGDGDPNGNFTGVGLAFGFAADTPFDSSNSIVRGLVLNEWILGGILIVANNVSVAGNFIGTDPHGTTQMANANGVVTFGNNTVIGINGNNPDIADRNVIAGSFGIWITNIGACVGSLSNLGTTVKGNLIGLNKAGTEALGNSAFGVFTEGSLITIGGTTPIERNIIAGHSNAGIMMEGANIATIQGNYIGTDISGTTSLSNQEGVGVAFYSSANNTIGGSVPGTSNVISGWESGIVLGNQNSNASVNNTIQGNFIGTDYTGTQALPNNNGILVNDNSNIIGGSGDGEGNIISGNIKAGITIYATNNTIIQGNHIGVDATNTQPIGNGYAGIQLGLAGGAGGNQSGGAALDNLIGGEDAIDGNFIGANGVCGISVESYSSGNDIRNNIFGDGALANGQEDVRFLCSQSNIEFSN